MPSRISPVISQVEHKDLFQKQLWSSPQKFHTFLLIFVFEIFKIKSFGISEFGPESFTNISIKISSKNSASRLDKYGCILWHVISKSFFQYSVLEKGLISKYTAVISFSRSVLRTCWTCQCVVTIIVQGSCYIYLERLSVDFSELFFL